MPKSIFKDACTTTVTGMSANDGAPAANDAGFAFLEHTADVGVKAWGPDPGAAIAAATRGMYTIMLGEDPACATGLAIAHEVAVSGETWPDLVVNWLAELLFFFSVDGVVAQTCAFSTCALPRCSASVAGVLLEDSEESAGIEIKAVTYHQLDVAILPNRTTIQVYFDI